MAQQNAQLVKKTIRHMGHMNAGHQVGGILLTGDPGIGKTSTVNLIGKLLGLRVIVIEVPHVTEEHLINIPFVVITPTGGQKHMKASVPSENSESDTDYRIVLAQSNLYTQMTQGQRMSDEQYLEYIKTQAPVVKRLYQALGGTEQRIPAAIQQARAQYTSILFLDEFYRQTSMRIRNILRGILNGNIGMHRIPKDVYIMYASNMRDQGLDNIPSNHQFTAIEQRPPSKGDWFDWLVDNYENHENVKLNPKMIEIFKEALEDADISRNDLDSEVRTSPRRWEQLLVYINSSIPVESPAEARALLTNVRNSFLHYKTGAYSSMAKKVISAVQDVIAKTGGSGTGDGEQFSDPAEWRDTLNHYIKQQMKSGGARKHIPVVSGAPGIGKTTQAATVAAEHDLRLIDIDLGEIYADDAIGLPIPGARKDDNITVKFSMPKLYHQIMNKIKAADAAYVAELKKEDPASADRKIKEYEGRRWKYLIFFDELNRVDEKTFNALRRVVLEKNFGAAGDDDTSLALPKESIVVAAINPEGGGTTELTDHFRDVIDVIPAAGNWPNTRKWLMNKNITGVHKAVPPFAMAVVDEFIKKFKSKSKDHPTSQAPFYIDASGMEIYVSPREYADMYATLVREVGYAFDEGMSDDDADVRQLIVDATAEALRDSLNMPFYKAEGGIDSADFFNTLDLWVDKLPMSMFKELINRKGENKVTDVEGASEGSYLSAYMNGTKKVINMPNDPNLINSNNLSNNSQVIEEVREMLKGLLKTKDSVTKYLLTQSLPKVELQGEKLVETAEKVTPLESVFVGMLLTLHIHQFANDRLAIVGKAMNQSISEVRKALLKDNIVDEEMGMEIVSTTADIRSSIVDLLGSLE